MLLWHKGTTLAGRAKPSSESWGRCERRRVKHLNAIGGGVCIKSSCVHLGFLAIPQTGFLGGECLRFGYIVSFNPLSCQGWLKGFFALFIGGETEASGRPEGRARTHIRASVFSAGCFTPLASHLCLPAHSQHECVCPECAVSARHGSL